MKSEFKDRLKMAMSLRNIKQSELVEKTGIDKGQLSSWLSGKYKARQNNISLLSEALNVDEAWLMGYDVPMKQVSPHIKKDTSLNIGVKIPVLGYVAAGIPITAIEDVIDYEEIPEKMSNNGEYFGLKIAGDSMEPRIKKGDVVIVKQQSDVDTGDVAIVLVNGDEGTCKKVLKYEDGLSLVSFNPAYPPKFYTWKEVETIPVVICGKVVELRGKF